VTLPQALIDRDSPVPFYFQLAEMLEHEIVSGRWEAGLRLPSELELCTHFGVSRTTVRQALGRLEQEGLIARRKGQGTFVQEGRPRSWLLQSSAGFFQDESARLGRSVTSEIRRAERHALPTWACDALGLEPESVGVTLERIRSIDGLVAMYNVNHLPERFAGTVLSLKPDESLYECLHQEHGVEPTGGKRELEAVPAEELLGSLLGVPPKTPLVYIESVTWDRALQPFDCYQSWLRTDRMKIDIEVAAAPANAAVAVEVIRGSAA
jgi:GntR family transcriptional regulator